MSVCDSTSVHSVPSMLSLYSRVEDVSDCHKDLDTAAVFTLYYSRVCEVCFTYSMQETVLTLPPEDKGHGNVSFATYYKFFIAGGNYLVLAVMFTLFILADVSTVLYLSYCEILYVCVHVCRVVLSSLTGGSLIGDIVQTLLCAACSYRFEFVKLQGNLLPAQHHSSTRREQLSSLHLLPLHQSEDSYLRRLLHSCFGTECCQGTSLLLYLYQRLSCAP